MHIIVSVVIPIYNVDLYLRQCLDSLGVLGRRDIEVILVNDGSTDSCRDICIEYKEKWSNIIFVDKENGGLSDARNKGTEVASGDFIYYVDSDDWLAPNAIKMLYEFAVAHDCDIVQCGFYYAFDNYLEYDNRWLDDYQEPFILNRDEALRELLKDEYINNFAWGKLYKSSLVKDNRFVVNKYFEDIYWQHLNVWHIKRYAVIPTPLYYYRQRNNSISSLGGIRYLDLIEGAENRLWFIQRMIPQFESLMADKLWDYAFNGARNNDQDIFRKELYRITVQYKSVFSKRLRRSVVFILSECHVDIFWRFSSLISRACGRLTSKKIKRIELKSIMSLFFM